MQLKMATASRETNQLIAKCGVLSQFKESSLLTIVTQPRHISCIHLDTFYIKQQLQYSIGWANGGYFLRVCGKERKQQVRVNGIPSVKNATGLNI